MYVCINEGPGHGATTCTSRIGRSFLIYIFPVDQVRDLFSG